MKIDDFQSPDLEGRADDPQVRLIRTILEQVGHLTEGAQGRLTFDSNLNSEMVELKLNHGERTLVRLQRLRGAPREGYIGYTEEAQGATLVWERGLEESLVYVTVTWATDPGESKTVRIRFFGTD